MAKDPVCGMQVDEKTPPAVSVFKGTTYYFCCQSCKQQFEEEPEKYTSK